LEKLFETALDGDESRWRLRLVPRDPQARRLVSVVVLEGSGADLLRLALERPNGDRTLTTMTPHEPP
jgi:hypothetical protein